MNYTKKTLISMALRGGIPMDMNDEINKAEAEKEKCGEYSDTGKGITIDGTRYNLTSNPTVIMYDWCMRHFLDRDFADRYINAFYASQVGKDLKDARRIYKNMYRQQKTFNRNMDKIYEQTKN